MFYFLCVYEYGSSLVVTTLLRVQPILGYRDTMIFYINILAFEKLWSFTIVVALDFQFIFVVVYSLAISIHIILGQSLSLFFSHTLQQLSTIFIMNLLLLSIHLIAITQIHAAAIFFSVSPAIFRRRCYKLFVCVVSIRRGGGYCLLLSFWRSFVFFPLTLSLHSSTPCTAKSDSSLVPCMNFSAWFFPVPNLVLLRVDFIFFGVCWCLFARVKCAYIVHMLFSQ